MCAEISVSVHFEAKKRKFAQVGLKDEHFVLWLKVGLKSRLMLRLSQMFMKIFANLKIGEMFLAVLGI